MNFKTLVRLRLFRRSRMNVKLLLLINTRGLPAASHLSFGRWCMWTLGGVVW
jgi:hypothetical protein